MQGTVREWVIGSLIVFALFFLVLIGCYFIAKDVGQGSRLSDEEKEQLTEMTQGMRDVQAEQRAVLERGSKLLDQLEEEYGPASSPVPVFKGLEPPPGLGPTLEYAPGVIVAPNLSALPRATREAAEAWQSRERQDMDQLLLYMDFNDWLIGFMEDLIIDRDEIQDLCFEIPQWRVHVSNIHEYAQMRSQQGDDTWTNWIQDMEAGLEALDLIEAECQ